MVFYLKTVTILKKQIIMLQLGIIFYLCIHSPVIYINVIKLISILLFINHPLIFYPLSHLYILIYFISTLSSL
jgi:hypothetical protein